MARGPISFRFEGGRELEAAFAELGSRSTRKRTAERGLTKSAEPIRADAEDRAPELTGRTAERVEIGKPAKRSDARSRDRDLVEVFVGISNRDRPFQPLIASMLEFGGQNNDAQPFMRPAFDSKAQAALTEIAADQWAEIRKSAERLAKRRARAAR